MLGRTDAAREPAARRRRRVHAAGPLPGARRSARHDQAALFAGADCRAAARAGLRRAPRRPDRRAPSTASLVVRSLEREAFTPDVDRLPQHDADARRRRRRDGRAQGALRRAAVLLRPARLDRTPQASMLRAPAVDGMFVGEPEDAALQLARLRVADGDLATIASLTFRRDGIDRPAPRPGLVRGLHADAVSGVGPACRSRSYALPLVNRPYVIVETSRGCPYSCDFCVAPIHQGHKFREREREGAGRRDRAQLPRARRRLLLPVGRHGHAEREDVQRVLRGADRAEPADPVVRQRPRRQPDRSGLRASAAPLRLLDARDGHRVASPKRSARTW